MPPQLVSPDRTWCWCAKGDFVEGLNVREQEERINYGGKMIKDPSAQQINDVISSFGKDHQAMNDYGCYGKTLGLEDGHVQMLSPGQFSQASATEEEKKLWEEQEAQERVDREARKAAAAAKKAAKPFDVSGVRTVMDPIQRDKANQASTKALTLKTECEELMKNVKEDPDCVAVLQTAIEVLEKRMAMLDKAIGDDQVDLDANKKLWGDYLTSIAGQEEPWPSACEYLCLAAVQHELTHYNVVNHVQVKEEKARLTNIAKQ